METVHSTVESCAPWTLISILYPNVHLQNILDLMWYWYTIVK